VHRWWWQDPLMAASAICTFRSGEDVKAVMQWFQ
jgi:hypothetical protein